MSSTRWRVPGWLILAVLFYPTQLCAQVITTVAGGQWVFRGDGGLARNATLLDVGGVAVDAAGNVYACDARRGLVVKISPSGILTVVAGNGVGGFSGDGGPATSASLYSPNGVAVDTSGDLYVADSGNNRVRKVSLSGIISTVAGSGAQGVSGDGGPATSASLYSSFGVAVDAAGNLYIADTYNNRIQKVSASGTITTVGGSGRQGFSGDGGPATSAQLNNPVGVAVDARGNLYIADGWNHRIRRVSPSGIISTVAGNGAPWFSGDGGPATSTTVL